MREQEGAGQGGSVTGSTPASPRPRQDAAPEGGGGEGGGGGGGGGGRSRQVDAQAPWGHVHKAQDVLAQAASARVGEEEEVRGERHAQGAPGDGNICRVQMRARVGGGGGGGDCRDSDGEREGERDRERDREREAVLGVGGEGSPGLQGLEDSELCQDSGQESFDNSGMWESLDTIS